MVDSAILEMNYADYKGNLTDLIYYRLLNDYFALN